jgi:cytochrome oxidase Cu insertion factor (SCO1/SenC/PrrC family)
MLKRLSQLLLLLLSVFITGLAQQPKSSTAAQDTKPATQPAPPKTFLKVGQPAPEFTLTDTSGKPVKLSDFKGKKNVVLAFYVLAFTGG